MADPMVFAVETCNIFLRSVFKENYQGVAYDLFQPVQSWINFN